VLGLQQKSDLFLGSSFGLGLLPVVSYHSGESRIQSATAAGESPHFICFRASAICSPFPADDPDVGEDAGRALAVIVVPNLNDTMTVQVELGHLELDADEIV